MGKKLVLILVIGLCVQGLLALPIPDDPTQKKSDVSPDAPDTKPEEEEADDNVPEEGLEEEGSTADIVDAGSGKKDNVPEAEEEEVEENQDDDAASPDSEKKADVPETSDDESDEENENKKRNSVPKATKRDEVAADSAPKETSTNTESADSTKETPSSEAPKATEDKDAKAPEPAPAGDAQASVPKEESTDATAGAAEAPKTEEAPKEEGKAPSTDAAAKPEEKAPDAATTDTSAPKTQKKEEIANDKEEEEEEDTNVDDNTEEEKVEADDDVEDEDGEKKSKLQKKCGGCGCYGGGMGHEHGHSMGECGGHDEHCGGCEAGHEHCHECGHEAHEKCCHHHGHHHGFVHEWGQEEGCCQHGHGGHHDHEHCCEHEHGGQHHGSEECGGHHGHGGHHEGCCQEGGHHGHETGGHQSCGCGCGGGGIGGGGGCDYGGGGGYVGGNYVGGWGRNSIPPPQMVYHCRDIISTDGDSQPLTRTCIPIGFQSPYFPTYPGPAAAVRSAEWIPEEENDAPEEEAEDSQEEEEAQAPVTETKKSKDKKAKKTTVDKKTERDNIESPVKKQTVHVGYGYASGDNYRLGYNQGGMGGIAQSFNGKVVSNGADDLLGGFNKKKSDISKKEKNEKRNFGGHAGINMPGGYGMATPYGHPVTHPGFTTMGFPGHALASADVKNNIPHAKVKRQVFGQEPQAGPGMFAPAPEPMAAMQQEMPPQAMDQQGGPPMEMQGAPGFTQMMGGQGVPGGPEGAMMNLPSPQEEAASMRSFMPRYQDPPFSQISAMAGYGSPALRMPAGYPRQR